MYGPDDLGWGDTGYNGHPIIKTPNLNDMSRNGIRFDRFYSGAPVCSPTRGSCLTGRIGSIEYAEWWFKINRSWPVEGKGDFLLFDLIEDSYETRDLAAQKPEIVEKLKVVLEKWQESCRKSYAGKDYKE